MNDTKLDRIIKAINKEIREAESALKYALTKQDYSEAANKSHYLAGLRLALAICEAINVN